MNRRSFLSGLLKGVVAAAAAPQIITHGLGLKIPTYREIVMINPEWVNAPYEMSFIYDPSMVQTINGIVRFRGEDGILPDVAGMIKDPFPIRFKTADANPEDAVVPFIIQRLPRWSEENQATSSSK